MPCPLGNNRLFCLGFISLGILLILLGAGQITEASDTSPQTAVFINAIPKSDICDVCHEEGVDTVDSSVDLFLQRTAMDVFTFQRDHVLTGLQSEKLRDVQALLSRAHTSLRHNDPETARALVQHANQLLDELERQASLNERNSSLLGEQFGVLTRQELVLDNNFQMYHLLNVVTGMGWTASTIEDLAFAHLMTASIPRRAPPEDDAFVAYKLLYHAKPGDLLSMMAVSFFVPVHG